MKLGLVIGRFQPLHNGHVAIIQKAIEENDKVLVLVGSENKLADYKNPFGSEVRIHLIKEHFGDQVIIKGINDYPSDFEWIEDVVSRVNTIQEDPSKVCLYTSEKDSEYYATNFLYDLDVQSSEGLSATRVREFMYKNVVHTQVPEVSADFLTEFIGSSEWERLRDEFMLCTISKDEANEAHAFSNPIEPVVHAMVIQSDKVLLVKRRGVRGKGQLALPGGFLDKGETTRAGALRELHEETGLDLLNQARAAEVAHVVTENMNGLSTRTLGINYAYAVHPEETLEPIAGDDAEEVQWVSLAGICDGKVFLFYNHVLIIRQLLERIK